MRNKCSSVMLHCSSFSLSFGDGLDLRTLSYANNNIKSQYNLGNNYEVPPGQINTFLAGSNNFKVS